MAIQKSKASLQAVWGRQFYYTSFKTQQKTAYRQTVADGEHGVRPTSLKLSPVCRLAGESQDEVALAVQDRRQTTNARAERKAVEAIPRSELVRPRRRR